MQNPGRLPRKRAGARFCKSFERRHKNAGSAPIKALSCAGNEPQRCVRRRLRSVSSTPPRQTPRTAVFGFLPLLRSDELRAPPRRLRAPQLAAEPLTRCLHGRAPRASTYGRNPRGERAIGLAGGRGLYPTASSQPTARGRAPARLRTLERAPWRTPDPGQLLDHILYFWMCRLLSSACCYYGCAGPCTCTRIPPSNH